MFIPCFAVIFGMGFLNKIGVLSIVIAPCKLFFCKLPCKICGRCSKIICKTGSKYFACCKKSCIKKKGSKEQEEEEAPKETDKNNTSIAKKLKHATSFLLNKFQPKQWKDKLVANKDKLLATKDKVLATKDKMLEKKDKLLTILKKYKPKKKDKKTKDDIDGKDDDKLNDAQMLQVATKEEEKNLAIDDAQMLQAATKEEEKNLAIDDTQTLQVATKEKEKNLAIDDEQNLQENNQITKSTKVKGKKKQIDIEQSDVKSNQENEISPSSITTIPTSLNQAPMPLGSTSLNPNNVVIIQAPPYGYNDQHNVGLQQPNYLSNQMQFPTYNMQPQGFMSNPNTQNMPNYMPNTLLVPNVPPMDYPYYGNQSQYQGPSSLNNYDTMTQQYQDPNQLYYPTSKAQNYSK
jgi:hypothetical protein